MQVVSVTLPISKAEILEQGDILTTDGRYIGASGMGRDASPFGVAPFNMKATTQACVAVSGIIRVGRWIRDPIHRNADVGCAYDASSKRMVYSDPDAPDCEWLIGKAHSASIRGESFLLQIAPSRKRARFVPPAAPPPAIPYSAPPTSHGRPPPAPVPVVVPPAPNPYNVYVPAPGSGTKGHVVYRATIFTSVAKPVVHMSARVITVKSIAQSAHMIPFARERDIGSIWRPIAAGAA